VHNILFVDRELNPATITRLITVEEGVLRVQFWSDDIKKIRYMGWDSKVGQYGVH
jgi:hypothetical protein